MDTNVTSIWLRATALVVLVLGAGCSTPTAARPASTTVSDRAISWTMHSAEYQATTSGIFAAAAAALPALLADEAWTAALEQDSASAQGKPPAIVVDVDETMLDNSQYQWELAAKGESYDEQSWDAWIQRGKARAVPGAVEYAKRARALHVAIFYVTNRTCSSRGTREPCPQAAETLANLVAAGFPKPRAQQLLLRGMRREWSGDKSARRSHVSRNYRIVQLLGDDLGDFVSAVRGASEDRRNRMIQEHRSRWGRSWFLLPNPMYGSWQAALTAQ